MIYSLPEKIEKFVADVVANSTPSHSPVFILDMDGNALLGYEFAGNTPPCFDREKLGAQRSIPANANIAQLVESGMIVPRIFAQYPLDVRLPNQLRQCINSCISQGRLYTICFLTSRAMEDALQILADSGIDSPHLVTLIADSGAIARFEGVQTNVAMLNAPQQGVLNNIATLLPDIETVIDTTLIAHDFNVKSRPEVSVERKNIACNFHYRKILEFYDCNASSSLAQDIAQALASQCQKYLDASAPSDFALLHGPATIEIKLVGCDKSNGIEALVKQLKTKDVKPSALIYAGDDVCSHHANGAVFPGTDYFAFLAIQQLKRTALFPVYTIHTLHPLGSDLLGVSPDPAKTIAPFGIAYENLEPATITLATPLALEAIVVDTVTRLMPEKDNNDWQRERDSNPR
ncbi:MAG: hypothetical protein MK052_00500 [Alphaproteobacteria bacterium]|nr:hypothetical protein [Alphaproteobacteria bacterium]